MTDKIICETYNSLAQDCSSKLDTTFATQIIIDGVDVSGCKYYKYKFCYCSKGVDGLEKKCYDYPNCYYKQLARKTEECQKLEETVDNLLKIQHQLAANCEKYRQTIEEIKEAAEKLINYTPEYDNCYYKEECGENCTPKKNKKIDVCLYEEVDKITQKCEVIND